MDILRFATVGSVDTGKSTLVGRLLYETGAVAADQLDSISRASAARGLGAPDLSLLTDGLRAEREQNITIDVAYRYFSTPNRTFVLADNPGHVQYTRNTVGGASTAQLAVLLVDAERGIVEQTRRHAAVLALLRVPRLLLAVNKMDRVGHAKEVFEDISGRFTETATALGYRASTIDAVPVSALNGDNVVTPSVNMSWYSGPTFLTLLEEAPIEAPGHALPLRLPVQYVIRAGGHYRGYAGRVAAGTVRLGDRVVVLPSGVESVVERIDTPQGPTEAAGTGRSVTVLLGRDVDIARGDLLAAADENYRSTAEFDATLCWLSNTPLRTGARLLLRHGTRITPCVTEAVHERVDVRTSVREPTDTLVINDIGRVSLRTADPLPADAYTRSRSTGSMLLIAPSTGETVAAGLIPE